MSPCMATVVSSVAGPPTQVGAVIGPSLQHPFTQANICPQCERALDTVKQSPRQSMLAQQRWWQDLEVVFPFLPCDHQASVEDVSCTCS